MISECSTFKDRLLKLGFVIGYLIFGFLWLTIIYCNYAQFGAPADFDIIRLAGEAVIHGQQRLLYPSLGSVNFDKTLFSSTPWLFLYPPNFAVFVAIFCMMPPPASYIVTQTALILSIWLSAKLAVQKSSKSYSVLAGMLLFALAFLPAAHSVAICQLSLILNLLPLVAGFRALISKQYYLAGSFWGVISLKPQPMPSVIAVLILVLVFCCQNKRERLCLSCGFLTVLSINVLLILLFFSTDGISIWLHSINLWLNSYLYGHLAYSENYWFISSLPMIVGYILKTYGNLAFGSLIPTTISLVALVIEVFVFYKIAKSTFLDRRTKLELLLLVLVAGLPIVSPYLRSYDLSTYFIAAWFCFYGSLAHLPVAKPLRLGLIIIWIVINIDMWTIHQQISLSTSLGPLIVCIVALAFWFCSLNVALVAASGPRNVPHQ